MRVTRLVDHAMTASASAKHSCCGVTCMTSGLPEVMTASLPVPPTSRL